MWGIIIVDLEGNGGSGMRLTISALTGIAVAAACMVQAKAADFRDVPPYAVVANWSGLYVGANIGFAHVGADVTASIPGFAVAASGSDTQFTGGVLAGYNWQHGNQVFGIEGDVNFLSDWNYLASLRGRYGMVYGNWLYYGTAGVGFVDSGSSISAPGFSFHSFNTAGFVAGAGAETKIGPRLSGGVEGLFYWFPDDSQNVGGVTVKTSADVFSIRARLTYQLDGGYDFLK
jgi:opacity protein-like surface antigen